MRNIYKVFLTALVLLSSQMSWATYYCNADCDLRGSEIIFSEEPRSGSYYAERCAERGGRGDHKDGFFICWRYRSEYRSVSVSANYESDARAEAVKNCSSYTYANTSYDYLSFGGLKNWKCDKY